LASHHQPPIGYAEEQRIALLRDAIMNLSSIDRRVIAAAVRDLPDMVRMSEPAARVYRLLGEFIAGVAA
jgi:hypothetical protein